MINGIAAVGLGVYLLVVAWHNRQGELWSNLRRDLFDEPDKAGFLKWFVAALGLYALSLEPKLRPIVGPLLFFAFVGLAISVAQKNPEILRNVSKVFEARWSLD